MLTRARSHLAGISILLSLGCSNPASSGDAGAIDAQSRDSDIDDGGSELIDGALGHVDGGQVDGGQVDGGQVDGAVSRTPCWPFDRPSIETLRGSPRRVFAHYFSPYPISLDNQPSATDYYARNYLAPAGEGGIHEPYGGLLRERPLPRPPWPADSAWEELDMEIEVQRAVDAGLDGFTFDVINPNPSSPHRRRLDALLAAVPRVDATFAIQLVLDMTATSFGGGGGTDEIARTGIRTLFEAIGADPSLQRLDDGRVVVSAFAAERRSVAFWNDALAELEAMGHRVAFVPMPIGSWASNRDHFAGMDLYGASSWGSGTLAGATALRTVASGVHEDGLVWMAPVRPQDSRPKEQVYTESSNSGAFRAQWLAAIEGDADWVQLITWNDYSEDSEMAPSSRTQTGFYDLTAYYTTWFKTGSAPPIVRDAVFYFHRTHSMDPAVAPPARAALADRFRLVAGPAGEDFIEVVGLLAAPGTLEIEIDGDTSRQDVGAGIQSFRVPLVPGTPIVRIVRDGAVVAELTSDSPITNEIDYQDPLYHAGSSMTCAM